MARLTVVPLPDIELPESRPTVPVSDFERRLTAAAAMLKSAALDFLVVYGDRERAADLHYLTGVDPRFEEGLFILSRDGERTIFLGNENQGYAPDPELGIDVKLYQEFSPQGQLRSAPVQLETLLRGCGISHGARVGVVGGKYFTAGYVPSPTLALGVPAFLADGLRSVAGADTVTNAQRLFVAPGEGLRTRVSVHELAEFEYSSAIASASVHSASLAVAPGMREDAIASRLIDHGLPYSAHTMVNVGEKVRRGLSSPSARIGKRGEPFQIAQGLRGSLTCRSGMIAASANDLAPSTAGYFEPLTLNYFDTLLAWFSSVRIGATGGEVFAAADRARDAALWAFALNPGHTLHFEEWLDSPFIPENSTSLESGNVLQGDIIPVWFGPGTVGVNIEDGLALADTDLRNRLADLYPEAWARIESRRGYLEEEIGIDLDESVLPLSNTPLWHAPYVLDPTRALTA